MNFKDFLLTESSGIRNLLSDLITSTQDVEEDLDNINNRQLQKLTDHLVNRIRRIIHSPSKIKQKTLEDLQKAAVFLAKTKDEKGDLKEALPIFSKFLMNIADEYGIKFNDISSEKGNNVDVGDVEQQVPPENSDQTQSLEQPQEQDPNLETMLDNSDESEVDNQSL